MADEAREPAPADGEPDLVNTEEVEDLEAPASDDIAGGGCIITACNCSESKGGEVE